MQTYQIDGHQVHRREHSDGDPYWICNCADYIQRERVLGASFCVHIARVLLHIRLGESHEGISA